MKIPVFSVGFPLVSPSLPPGCVQLLRAGAPKRTATFSNGRNAVVVTVVVDLELLGWWKSGDSYGDPLDLDGFLGWENWWKSMEITIFFTILMWKRMVTPLDIWMWKWFFRKIFPTKPNPIDVTTGRLQPGEQCTIRCREPYYVQNWDVQITIILDSQKSVRKLRRFYRRKISIKVSTCPYYYQIWYSLIFDRTDNDTCGCMFLIHVSGGRSGDGFVSVGQFWRATWLRFRKGRSNTRLPFFWEDNVSIGRCQLDVSLIFFPIRFSEMLRHLSIQPILKRNKVAMTPAFSQPKKGTEQ